VRHHPRGRAEQGKANHVDREGWISKLLIVDC
jgi:hypothetical protein